MALILCCCLWLGAGGEPPEIADPAAGIEWKKSQGAEKFKEALSAYEAKKYKEAHKLFKKARSMTKNKKSKREVHKWVECCLGAVELKRFELMAENPGKRLDAYKKAESARRRYRGTAIEPEYQSFLEELEAELFHPLESFDRPGERFSTKHGKEFVSAKTESEFVKQGAHSLRWKVNSSPAELKVKELPASMSRFRAVSFWLHFSDKDAGIPYQVTFMGKGSSKVDDSSGQRSTDNGYRKQMKSHRGWRRVELPLKSFQSFGKVSWETVKDFRIRFVNRRGLVVHVDDIVLVK